MPLIFGSLFLLLSMLEVISGQYYTQGDRVLPLPGRRGFSLSEEFGPEGFRFVLPAVKKSSDNLSKRPETPQEQRPEYSGNFFLKNFEKGMPRLGRRRDMPPLVSDAIPNMGRKRSVGPILVNDAIPNMGKRSNTDKVNPLSVNDAIPNMGKRAMLWDVPLMKPWPLAYRLPARLGDIHPEQEESLYRLLSPMLRHVGTQNSDLRDVIMRTIYPSRFGENNVLNPDIFAIPDNNDRKQFYFGTERRWQTEDNRQSRDDEDEQFLKLLALKKKKKPIMKWMR